MILVVMIIVMLLESSSRLVQSTKLEMPMLMACFEAV